MKLKIAVRTNATGTKYKERIIDGELLKRKVHGFTFFIHKTPEEDYGKPYTWTISEYETGFACRNGLTENQVKKKFKELVLETEKEKFIKTITDCKKKYGILNKLP